MKMTAAWSRWSVEAILVGGAVIALSACATRGVYQPASVSEVGVVDRVISETMEGVTVSVAVPTPEEANELFGFKMGKKGIQAVWLEVTNNSEHDYWFMPHALDAEYYSPLEVAWMGRGRYTKEARREMERSFHKRAMPFLVPAGQTVSGYSFANQTLGARHVLVELVGDHQDVLSFDFLVRVPSFSTDYQQVDFENLYEGFEDLDREELRQWLGEQPATVTNQKRNRLGDPLNIAVVGTNEAVWPAFARAGWHVTETMSASSVWRTMVSSVFRRSYLYSPISPLYVWDRPQDIALQKARATVDERNHLRLWLAPVTCGGELVWLGQISRDIGVRFTTKSPTISTHKIDPDVDETRSCLIQELIYAQGLAAFAFVGGVGAAPIDAPRGNLTGDPYFTDGLRAVLFLSEKRVPIDQLDFIEWEMPPS
jgi:hypothetical protein